MVDGVQALRKERIGLRLLCEGSRDHGRHHAAPGGSLGHRVMVRERRGLRPVPAEGVAGVRFDQRGVEVDRERRVDERHVKRPLPQAEFFHAAVHQLGSEARGRLPDHLHELLVFLNTKQCMLLRVGELEHPGRPEGVVENPDHLPVGGFRRVHPHHPPQEGHDGVGREELPLVLAPGLVQARRPANDLSVCDPRIRWPAAKRVPNARPGLYDGEGAAQGATAPGRRNRLSRVCSWMRPTAFEAFRFFTSSGDSGSLIGKQG